MTKFLGMGKSDVQENVNVSPFGFESNPVKGVVGIQVKTSVDGENFVVGYIGKANKTESGEVCVYSTDDDGNYKIGIIIRKNGTIEFGGDDGNLTRYQELESAFNELKGDFNDLVSKYNTHIHVTTATIGTGGPGVISPTTSTETQSTADISGAKIDRLKTL